MRILLNDTAKSFIDDNGNISRITNTNVSKLHKPPLNRKGTLIRFDTEKLKTFREVFRNSMNKNIKF